MMAKEQGGILDGKSTDRQPDSQQNMSVCRFEGSAVGDGA